MLSESDVEDHLLELMNDERAANGLPPHVRVGALDAAARAQTELVMSKAVVAGASPAPRTAEAVSEQQAHVRFTVDFAKVRIGSGGDAHTRGNRNGRLHNDAQ